MTEMTKPGSNPTGDPTTDELVAAIKRATNALEAEIEKIAPGRRRSVALTQLETASLWAVKAAVVGDD